ncbi:MAG: hypothetical protein IJU70_09850 [Lentisphaeria bacterium]|nr:hypothetical protein [Lentisphaeria bacterium]
MNEEKKTEAAPTEAAPAEAADSQKKKAPRWKRILKWTGSILLGLVIVLLIAFIFRDPIIKTATCKVGSFLTGTKVELEHFSSTLSGQVHLKGFSVGNPEGYSPAKAIEFKEIFVSVDIPSVLSDTIKVNEIRVAGMFVNFETKFKETNLGAIQSNLERISGSGKEEAPSGSGKVADKNKANQQKVYIAKLDATDNSVAITSSTINQTFKLPLPPVHLTDIGGDSIADTLSELTSQLITSISKAAVNIGGAIGSAATQAGEAVGSALKATGKGLQEGGAKLLKPFTNKK